MALLKGFLHPTSVHLRNLHLQTLKTHFPLNPPFEVGKFYGYDGRAEPGSSESLIKDKDQHMMGYYEGLLYKFKTKEGLTLLADPTKARRFSKAFGSSRKRSKTSRKKGGRRKTRR